MKPKKSKVSINILPGINAENAKPLIIKKTLFIGIKPRRCCMNAGKKSDAFFVDFEEIKN